MQNADIKQPNQEETLSHFPHSLLYKSTYTSLIYEKIKFSKCAYTIYTATTKITENIFLCAFSMEIKDVSLKMEE